MKIDKDGTNKIRKCEWIREERKEKKKEKEKGEQIGEREKTWIERERKGKEKQKWKFSRHSDSQILTVRE